MTELDRIAVGSTACPYCAAAPGQPCTSPRSDKRARYTHQARVEPVRLGWLMGYREGGNDALDQAVRDGVLKHLDADLLRRASFR